VQDLAFYNAGCSGLKGWRRIVIPFRRLLRRLLRPIFQRQVALFEQVFRREDLLEAQIQTTMAFGWDYVALVRRLAVLEDRVEALMVEREEVAARAQQEQLEPRSKVA
jgi:hypothetical protein